MWCARREFHTVPVSGRVPAVTDNRVWDQSIGSSARRVPAVGWCHPIAGRNVHSTGTAREGDGDRDLRGEARFISRLRRDLRARTWRRDSRLPCLPAGQGVRPQTPDRRRSRQRPAVGGGPARGSATGLCGAPAAAADPRGRAGRGWAVPGPGVHRRPFTRRDAARRLPGRGRRGAAGAGRGGAALGGAPGRRRAPRRQTGQRYRRHGRLRPADRLRPRGPRRRRR